MRGVVKVAFTDKENMSDVYYEGDVFRGSEERVNELVASGHVEIMAEQPDEKPRRGRKPRTVKPEV